MMLALAATLALVAGAAPTAPVAPTAPIAPVAPVAVQDPRPVPIASPVREVRRGDQRLRGIDTVDVVILALGAESTACGLAIAALQRAAADTLQRGGLRATISEKDSSWFYTVYVSVMTSRVGDRCASATRTRLATRVDGIPEIDRMATDGAWGSLLIGDMTLFEQDAMAASLAGDHAAAVHATLGTQLDALTARVRSSQK